MLQTSKSIISSHNLNTTVDEKNTVLTSYCKIAVKITDQGMQILSNSALTFQLFLPLLKRVDKGGDPLWDGIGGGGVCR